MAHLEGWQITPEKASEIRAFMPDHIDFIIDKETDDGIVPFIEKWVYERYIGNPEKFGIDPAANIDQVFDPLTDSVVTLRNDYRLLRYVPEELQDKPVTTINYQTEVNGRLQPIVTAHDRGEVTEITLYAEVFRDPYGLLYGTEPIVKEEFEYFRDPTTGLITHRHQQIDYYYEDGTMQSPKEKLRIKYYTPEDALAIGEKRRKNTIDFIKVPISGMISATESVDSFTAFALGSSFLEHLEDEISSFIKVPRLNLLPIAVNNLTSADFSWLENIIIPGGTTNQFGTAPEGINITIKDFILDQINIG